MKLPFEKSEENPVLPGRGTIEVAHTSAPVQHDSTVEKERRLSGRSGRSTSFSSSRRRGSSPGTVEKERRFSGRSASLNASRRHRRGSPGIQSLFKSVNASSSRRYSHQSRGDEPPAQTVRTHHSKGDEPLAQTVRTHHSKGAEPLALAVTTETPPSESRKAELTSSTMMIQRKSTTSESEDSNLASETENTTKEIEDFTNDPHPSLETPLLYFFLRHHPKLLSAFQGFYDLRWDIAYPLQNRIPCTSCLRKIKIILTWSELFLLLPFFAFLILGTIFSFVDPSVSISGHACRTPLILCFVTATKNNVLTFFLGMSVERAIKYHKISARLAYFNSLLHTYVAFAYPVTTDSSSNFGHFLFQNTVNSGGSLLVLFMTAMIVTALPIVRRKIFELFYLVHVVFAVLLMVAAFYHTGFLVPVLASLTWGLDVLVRKVYMPFFRYPRKAKLEIISDTVVELSFPKQDGFDFNPGQYIYLCVPKLGYLQWHPFSLSSSPKQKVVTLHIRKGGGWTNALYSAAKEQKEISVLMEGPYGSVGVDLTNPYKYQTVMLFSGGIGVTPMQSLCNSLMYEHNHGMRKLSKLSFVWIERDPVVMPEVDAVRREHIRHRESIRHLEASSSTNPFPPSSELGDSASMDLEKGFGKKRPLSKNASLARSLVSIDESDADGATRLATQLLLMAPPGQDTDARLEDVYPDDDVDTELPTNIVTRPQLRRMSNNVSFNVDRPNKAWKAGNEYSVDESFLDQAFGEGHNHQKESPLDLQVYLTNKQVSEATQRVVSPFVTIGRPDIQALFQEARQDALREHQPRVAVCVCAPLRIVDLCRKASAKYSDRYVTFDFHYEVFE